MKKVYISGKIGEDEKEAFNLIITKATISSGTQKIPGFTMKLIKACEEVNAVFTLDFTDRTFTIVMDDIKAELKEEVVEDLFPVEEKEVISEQKIDELVEEELGTDDTDDSDDWIS